MTESGDYISLPAQLSAPAPLNPELEPIWDKFYATVHAGSDRFRRALKRYCNHKYCEELDEIGPVLRVGGYSHDWPDGCSLLRLSRKSRSITLDIGISNATWRAAKSAQDIVEILVMHMTEAFRLILRRLKKEKYHVDEERLWSDWKKAAESLGVKIVVPPT